MTKKMIKKLGHIITGWGKFFGLIPISTAEAKLSELRLRICGKCNDSSKSKVMELVNGQAKYEYKLSCGICKCPCAQKTIVIDEVCPQNKW